MALFRHISVMPEEVMAYLAPSSGGVWVDGTLGGGGHAALILEMCSPDGLLIGFDRDREALTAAGERLAHVGDRFRAIHSDFAGMAEHLERMGVRQIDGFILDLGVSSYQLDTPERGFSFLSDAPLDMRMDATGDQSAADLVNTLSERELERILKEYGEERWARRIASFIVSARQVAPLLTTSQLVDVIKGAVPRAKWEERIHPATRTFQALRIAVNGELESLEKGLRAAVERLKPGGRGVVISFHSLEDRIVKQLFREYAAGCVCPRRLPVCQCGQQPRVRVLTSRPVMAGDSEVAQNPRSRSARLRAIEKLEPSLAAGGNHGTSEG